ncbi:hypothetical protein MLD38_008547 [Melastoma candidum]|nr:hypothetical protein MLD38_008547 [Melastoma candidum]
MRNPSSSSSSSSDGGDLPGGLAEGTYCVWGQGKPADTEAACKKSNSTGFSKLWRVKDLVVRSNSDGKDAFVFLNPRKPKDNAATETATPVLEMKPAPKPNSSKAKAKAKASASASASMVTTKKEGRQGGGHGYLVRNDKDKRRSYLPYKVGFFTNINGMSRNVHPY